MRRIVVGGSFKNIVRLEYKHKTSRFALLFDQSSIQEKKGVYKSKLHDCMMHSLDIFRVSGSSTHDVTFKHIDM